MEVKEVDSALPCLRKTIDLLDQEIRESLSGGQSLHKVAYWA